jgi:DNA primase
MAGKLTPEIRERIRSASDIVEIIGSYVPLKRNGANFTALCPFHKEKTPSFNVNAQKQIFHCFGCHKGGDVFKFVEEYENIGFMDAVRRLADRAKIPLEYDQNPAEQQTRHIKEQLLEIHEQVAQRWQNCLQSEAAGQVARDYLTKRGVSAEGIKLFRLGAAPDLWDDTVNWAKSKGFELAVMEKAGLVIKKEETGNYYDRFRGRLMFPICNEQGRVIGFSGRVLTGDEKTAKYVNSPETPIFTKSRVFFGLDKSKRAILDAGFAIICEGQLDLIACFTAGIQNMAAPQGTAFTEQHARIMKRYVNEIVLCFDSDNAGQNAAVRALDHLLASGLAVRVAIIPAPHDPDSFIKAFGGEAFRELIQKAEGFFDYYLNRLCQLNDAANDRGRLIILQSMAEAIYKTGNAVLIDKYAQKTALRLGVAPESVRSEFQKSHNAAPEPFSPEEESFEAAETSAMERPSGLELHLLKLMFLHEELMGTAAIHLDPAWLPHGRLRSMIEQIFAVVAAGKWQGVPPFLAECEPAELRGLITEVAAEDRKMPNPEQQLADVILKLRNQHFDREQAASLQRASQPGISEADRIQELRLQQQYRALKRTPLTPRQK